MSPSFREGLAALGMWYVLDTVWPPEPAWTSAELVPANPGYGQRRLEQRSDELPGWEPREARGQRTGQQGLERDGSNPATTCVLMIPRWRPADWRSCPGLRNAGRSFSAEPAPGLGGKNAPINRVGGKPTFRNMPKRSIAGITPHPSRDAAEKSKFAPEQAFQCGACERVVTFPEVLYRDGKCEQCHTTQV